MLRVAVVGSGPSGVFTAQALVQQETVPGVTVDVLDRLPCPYGLVRYGVAPDHEKIKSLQNTLRTSLEHPGITFLGNVPVGQGPGEVPPERLRELYHAVVYCVGAASARRLGIPGEDLPGSFSATDFVAWYSAHPDSPPGGFTLPARSAVVIGVGNVAVDVARVLARGADELAPTDVPHTALSALADSRVTDIHMVGRRGPAQAKFTTKELRELGSLRGASALVRAEEAALDPAWQDASALPGIVRRNVEVLRGWAREPAPERGRRIHVRFFLRPVALLGDEAVRAVRFERTVPDESGGVRGTGEFEEIEAQLVLRSVGYRGVPIAGLPFDEASGTVPHAAGRVLRDGAPSPGEYVAGWIKRGPTGVIGTNRPCAKETVQSLLADAGPLLARHPADDPRAALRAAGADPVEWPGWLGIEAAETELGRSLGRRTVKIPDWEGLLVAAGRGRG
ncbi:FAD-dependent oxidoreductase [Streptomyces sp. AV19]|uniref:FAD-dependent oxidoreductase n=1 Tax=Streptomyces sp. AV19 TaxID=2793068 RepID=UPI0018FE39DD|nr:FAD-dependent oxidoreductase [Streptomyces sp. AV19]MBH1938076.1 FAD-dependent oxidoreductase [Streptomyces sp. AV19]MDG4536689.1 FAD-dependent oxidoreductase [Streptomyces sp. AV19]